MAPSIDKLIGKAVFSAGSGSNATQIAVLSRWSRRIRQYNLALTRLWRRYGVKISFFLTFYLIWSGFKTIIIEQDPDSTRSYNGFQSFWLASHRFVTLFIVTFTLPGVIGLLCYTVPVEGYDDTEEDEDKINNNNTIRQHPLKIILRIITRGDYPKLIQDSIEYHENLFKSYWRHQNDQIEIHVSSEKPLSLARPRVPGLHRCEIKEYDVPLGYTTPNNTLYKGRNNHHALQRYLEEAKQREEHLDRVWAIPVDEDVFLTRIWIQEFNDTVLSSKVEGEYKFVSSPTRPIFLDQTLGMSGKRSIPPIVPFFGEIFRMTLDLSRVWWQAKLFGRAADGFHGACYAVRLDIEARIGYDCGGKFLSVGDDTTFSHEIMMAPDVKLKFMNAWYLEGAPHTTFIFMKQRARWVHNYLYFLLFSDVPIRNKIRLASFLVVWTLVMPYGVLCWGSGYILMALNGRVVDFFPCGPAWPVADVFCCISAACVIYWYIYGCALLLPWYWAVLVSLTFSTYIPVLPLHFIGAVAAIWGLISAFHELATGSADFAMTEKKAK